jgi:hypothetical protein
MRACRPRPRRLPPIGFSLSFSLSVAACGGREEPAPLPPVTAAERATFGPISGPRHVETSASFDLVATAEGAVLVFAAPQGEGGGLRALPLDARGASRGAELPVVARDASGPPLPIAEVVAASSGGKLGIAWIAHETPTQTTILATHGGADAQAFAPATSFGPSVVLPRGGRGRLALAAGEDGVLTLSHRRDEGPCEAQSGTCARYRHRRLGRPEAASRGTDGNEVKVPCEPLLPGSVWSAGVWFQGVCSALDGARGHVFAIREQPSYAAVYDGPAGCTPVGVVALPDGAAAVARCAAGLQIARLGSDGRATQTATRATLSAPCEGGRAQLRATGDGVTIALPLQGPQSGVEALLPATLARPGARAAWTGEALLVAEPVGRDVFLRRYACRPGLSELARDDDGA